MGQVHAGGFTASSGHRAVALHVREVGASKPEFDLPFHQTKSLQLLDGSQSSFAD